MPSHLVIERLEFQGHCGVTAMERQTPQPIAVDLELDCPPGSFAAAAATGDITKAVDYTAVAARVIEVGTKEPYVLVETLADRLMEMLFAEFPVTRAKLWVRKVVPPVPSVCGSVGVKLERAGSAQTLGEVPAQFLKDSAQLLPHGLALDVAAGRGRNALHLASLGWTVEAIDRDEQALAELAACAQRRNLTNVTVRTLDLETDQTKMPDFPHDRYDVILVFFYLYRPLFPALLRALKPGGMLVYETFLIENHLHRQHPRRREFCLEHNELLTLAHGLRVLHYEEGEHAGGHGSEPAFTARLLAQRES